MRHLCDIRGGVTGEEVEEKGFRRKEKGFLGQEGKSQTKSSKSKKQTGVRSTLLKLQASPGRQSACWEV